jgi:ion transport 2 domain-containing protein
MRSAASSRAPAGASSGGTRPEAPSCAATSRGLAQAPDSRLARWERITEWPLTFAAVLFLAVYSVEVIGDLHGRDHLAAETAIDIVWAVFAADYAVRLRLAPDRGRWFAHHLLDLAVVALPLLRPLRLLRLATPISVLQRTAGLALRGRIAVYTAGAAILLTYVGALATLDAEKHAPGATITSFPKALWWAFVTITSVGYGDHIPTTGTGRTVAALLMIAGIAVIGTVTATLASWIVSRVAEETAEEEAATRQQVAALQRQVTDLTGRIAALQASVGPPPRGSEGPGGQTDPGGSEGPGGSANPDGWADPSTPADSGSLMNSGGPSAENPGGTLDSGGTAPGPSSPTAPHGTPPGPASRPPAPDASAAAGGAGRP